MLNRSIKSPMGGELTGTYGLVLQLYRLRHGVGQIVPAPGGDRAEAPVRFDELERRDMIRVSVRDVTALAEWRHDDQGNAGAVAEVIERLNIAGVVVSAALVEVIMIAV